MKNDLATSIVVAIVGVLIAYFLSNLLADQLLPIEDQKVKTVDSSFSTEVSDPNPEVFNYKAINPTVEVYVGEDDDQGNS